MVVITGASSGIGRATAHQLAGQGDALVLLARAERPLLETAAECEELGADHTTVVTADVTQRAQVEETLRGVATRYGRIDAVVHSAGVVGYGDFVDIPADVFDQVVTTNVLGTANVARSALTLMRARGGGSMILLSSVIGHIAVPRMSPYVVSKWAVRSLARELQLEHRSHPNVHVTCIEPGSVDTPIYVLGATYAGAVGRPPPPVVSPERVARAISKAIDHPRHTVRVGPVNRLMELGFTVTPRLYDALVGPLVALSALDRTPADATPGNVLEPRPRLNALHGDQGSSVRATARAVRDRLSQVVQSR